MNNEDRMRFEAATACCGYIHNNYQEFEEFGETARFDFVRESEDKDCWVFEAHNETLSKLVSVPKMKEPI